jgi:hypothetical protein
MTAPTPRAAPTPGAPTPYTPYAPSTPYNHSSEATAPSAEGKTKLFLYRLVLTNVARVVAAPNGDWVRPNMEIEITEGPHSSMHAKVASVSGDSCQVQLLPAMTYAEISTSSILPVAPSKKERCVFVSGNEEGEMGQLIGMDGGDAIVKMDKTADFTITPLNAVCKVLLDD